MVALIAKGPHRPWAVRRWEESRPGYQMADSIRIKNISLFYILPKRVTSRERNGKIVNRTQQKCGWALFLLLPQPLKQLLIFLYQLVELVALDKEGEDFFHHLQLRVGQLSNVNRAALVPRAAQ